MMFSGFRTMHLRRLQVAMNLSIMTTALMPVMSVTGQTGGGSWLCFNSRRRAGPSSAW